MHIYRSNILEKAMSKIKDIVSKFSLIILQESIFWMLNQILFKGLQPYLDSTYTVTYIARKITVDFEVTTISKVKDIVTKIRQKCVQESGFRKQYFISDCSLTYPGRYHYVTDNNRKIPIYFEVTKSIVKVI